MPVLVAAMDEVKEVWGDKGNISEEERRRIDKELGEIGRQEEKEKNPVVFLWHEAKKEFKTISDTITGKKKDESEDVHKDEHHTKSTP